MKKKSLQQDMNKEILNEFQHPFPIDNHLGYLQKIDEVLQEYFLLT
jgi:hypothetical protein